MGKKPIVSVTYENERISIKNSLPYLKCVLRLSCVVHGPIQGRFMGFNVNGFLFHFRRLQKRQVFSPYKSLYFECYATMPRLADANISSLGYLWCTLVQSHGPQPQRTPYEVYTTYDSLSLRFRAENARGMAPFATVTCHVRRNVSTERREYVR